MGRRKKGESLGEKITGPFSSLKDETTRGVIAVGFFVVGVFLMLASFDKAGAVGEKSFGLLVYLFGYGYYFLAVLFFTLCISFFRNLDRKFSIVQIVGSALLFFGALAFIAIFTAKGGGVLGSIIASPLLRLFDIYASVIIVSAIIIISSFITFDTTLKFELISKILANLKSKKGLNVPDESVLVTLGNEEKQMTLGSANAYVRENTPKEGLKNATLDQKSETSENGFINVRPRNISLKPFTPPPVSLIEKDRGKPGVGDIKANANIIKRTLQNFGIAVEMDEVSIGPSITRYALKPAEGVKLSKIIGLQNNLELALAAHPVRIEAPIPGKSLVGIEIPNITKTTVGLGTLIEEGEFQNSDKPLLITLGRGISGKSHFANISKMPHLLIAGSTGSGKSVTIHAAIASLLYRNSPETLKFIMIDPKRVELTLYNKIPHLLTPVITDAKKVILALKWASKEMDRRYDILEENGVRDIESYHKNILEPELEKARKKKLRETTGLPETMPYIVIVIDELADIMQTYPRELESAVVRLAQMSRAVGIHLILSTQRPSVNIITGLIKANIPSRIALQVASQVDSRTILDSAGAEKLLGAGDMLYMSGEMAKPQRLQSAFISETEVKKLVKYLADNYDEGVPSEISLSEESGKNLIFSSSFEEDGDELYEEAREIVINTGKASTSYLQRKLGVGYARAARLMDMLEEREVVGPGSGSKPRDVLIRSEQSSNFSNETDSDN